MKRLEIEWRHLDKAGNTCARCSETGRTLDETVAQLARECAARGVQVIYRETRLSERELPQSNMILFNGEPLESLLPGAAVSASDCPSCCEFTGRPTACRTVELQGRTYEAIPAALVRAAACRAEPCCETC
ncbi:MAG: DUF2703 domain-containing protein [Sulfuricaulis sp.]